MAEQFNQQSGLASILSGYEGGVAQRQKRQANDLDMAAKKQQMVLDMNKDMEGTSRYATDQGAVDADPANNYDESGHFQGYQKSVYPGDKRIIDQQVNDMGYGSPAAPSASPGGSPPPRPPQSADQIAQSVTNQDSGPAAANDRQNSRQAMIARMRAAGTLPPGFEDSPNGSAPGGPPPQPTPAPTARDEDQAALGPKLSPGDPKPLIVDRKGTADLIKHRRELEAKTLENGQKALLPPGTDAVDYDPNGERLPMSDGRQAIMAKETHVGAGPDTQVPGTVPPGQGSAQGGGQQAGGAAPSDDYSPAMIKAIRERAMTKPHDPMISVDMLPESIGDELKQRGVKAVPTSVAKTMLMNEGRLSVQGLKNQGGVGGIDPIATGLMTQIQRDGMTPGDAAEEYSKSGRPLTKAVLDSFYKSANLGNATTGMGLRKDSNALAHDRFQQTQNKEIAGVVQKASSSALTAAKGEMDGVMDARTAKSMIEQGDTNGLVGLIPMMITRAALTQRMSNQEISATTGLQGGGDVVNQMLAKIQGEGLTDENKQHFWKLADTLEQRHLQGIRAKTGAQLRTGLGALSALKLPPDQAQQAMQKALDPEQLIASVRGGGRTQSGPASSGNVTGSPQAPAGGPPPGQQEMKNAQLLSMKNSTLTAIRNGQRLNKDGTPMNPSQQRAAIQNIEKKFQEMTQKNLQGVQ
jgi:hypothetical protein